MWERQKRQYGRERQGPMAEKYYYDFKYFYFIYFYWGRGGGEVLVTMAAPFITYWCYIFETIVDKVVVCNISLFFLHPCFGIV